MTWHPKYVGGRIEFSNGEGAAITVFSTIDSDSMTINLTKLDIRLYNARWNSDGLIVQTEDGKTVLIRCNRCKRERYKSTEEMMSQWAGHDIISPEEGNRIRRNAEIQKRIDAKYDKVIVWCCYDEDLQYEDEILQSLVINQKQRIKETWNLAKQGDADAQNKVGIYYQNGIGVAKDNAEAVRWYKRAAEQGHANAQNNLGWMCQNGWGVEQNDTKAVEWYRKSAEQGNVYAQDNLGWMCQNGFGTEKNEAEAVMWYQKAADQGNSNAQNNLGWMYQNGLGVSQNYSEAVKWYKKAAYQGHDIAQNNLGWMYQNGWGIEQNDDEAIKWFQKSADQGNTYAQNNLNMIKNN